MTLGVPATVETTGIGKGGGIRWLTNPFFGHGRGAMFIVTLEVGLAAYTKGFARRTEAYAKAHAPWQDRTGDARQGLTAIGEQRLVRYTITLFHTVDYGIWLEVRWDGKYAIIVPTIEHMGPIFMAEMNLVQLMALGG